MPCERILFGQPCRRCGRKTVNRAGRCAACISGLHFRRPGGGKLADAADDFRRMYLAGATLAELMGRFRVNKRTLGRWRDRLGLPARPPGRPRKQEVA